MIKIMYAYAIKVKIPTNYITEELNIETQKSDL